MFLIVNAVGLLYFTNIGNDGSYVTPRCLCLRGHIAIWPMMLLHPFLNCTKKSVVAMMTWIVYVMNQWWAFIRTGAILSMACSTVVIIKLTALSGCQ